MLNILPQTYPVVMLNIYIYLFISAETFFMFFGTYHSWTCFSARTILLRYCWPNTSALPYPCRLYFLNPAPTLLHPRWASNGPRRWNSPAWVCVRALRALLVLATSRSVAWAPTWPSCRPWCSWPSSCRRCAWAASSPLSAPQWL